MMTMICCPAVLVAAGDNTLPPDLKPMLEHAAIVAEMIHACRHTRFDLAVRLGESVVGMVDPPWKSAASAGGTHE